MSTSSSTEPTIHNGLEGVVVAATSLAKIEGNVGRLSYRGYSIADLAQHATYEEVLYLLWYGKLPNKQEYAQLKEKLTRARTLSPTVMKVIKDLPTTGAPIDALRAGVTAMGMEDPTEDDLEHNAVIEKSIHMAGAMPTMLAAYGRLREGKQPVDPDPSLDDAANFLAMLRGEKPSELDSNAFNAYLVCLAEHSMNASTFSARVTISAISDVYSAIATALGTLKGVAHGGANMASMKMLFDIGSADNVEHYVDESLKSHRRLMGLGHRIYKARDPRVDILMDYSEKVSQEQGNQTYHNIAKKLEELTGHHPFFLERKLFPNVEFYSAPLLYMLGLQPDMMPGAFAISRIGGWTAHLLEQLEDNRLIRPSALYVGPDLQTYEPIDSRS
ncbi:MAG TPA: citrate/2-methylcitrate synthase [Nitrolancea sp.]|nr:citrate/2-methylcitrate synthase [Nitrolancea sp.]